MAWVSRQSRIPPVCNRRGRSSHFNAGVGSSSLPEGTSVHVWPDRPAWHADGRTAQPPGHRPEFLASVAHCRIPTSGTYPVKPGDRLSQLRESTCIRAHALLLKRRHPIARGRGYPRPPVASHTKCCRYAGAVPPAQLHGAVIPLIQVECKYRIMPYCHAKFGFVSGRGPQICSKLHVVNAPVMRSIQVTRAACTSPGQAHACTCHCGRMAAHMRGQGARRRADGPSKGACGGAFTQPGKCIPASSPVQLQPHGHKQEFAPLTRRATLLYC